MNYKFVIITILILGITFSAQARPNKMDDRIKTIKKIKLLESLDLDEATSEKMLVKYNAMQRSAEAKAEEIELHNSNLQKAIESQNKDEIVKMTKLLENSLDSMHSSRRDNMNELKTLLGDVQYAKFLVFEVEFGKELKEGIRKLHDKREKMRSR